MTVTFEEFVRLFDYTPSLWKTWPAFSKSSTKLRSRAKPRHGPNMEKEGQERGR